MQLTMEKTGIPSIDKFFNYGERDTFQKFPFQPKIQEVIDMFQSEYTQTLYNRKATAIIQFCEERPHGFFYEQVQGLTLLFQYAKVDLFQKQVMEMVPALQKVLEVVSEDKNNIFNKNAGSDELRYMRFVPKFLDSLEPFLKYEKHAQSKPQYQSLRQSIIIYLRTFAQRQIPQILSKDEDQKKIDPSDLTPAQALLTQGTKHLRAMCQSSVVEALVQLLYNYENQLDIIVPLLQTIAYMVSFNRLAYELCQRGILHLILQVVLLCKDFRNPIIQTAFEIFWSTIEGVGSECLTVLATQQYIWALQKMFVKVIGEGYKLQDKCLRNQILILVNYLLSLPETSIFFLTKKEGEAGRKQFNFLEILFEYAIIDEAKFYDNKPKLGDRKTLFGTGSEDLQFKKLIWNGLLTAIQANNEQTIAIAQRSSFIKYLLLYIDETNTSYAITRWSMPQLRELQQHALSILANVILHMKDDFEQKKGIFCLTKFLSNVTDIERRQKCLKAFSNASLFEEAYKLKISEEGVIDYLLQFLQNQESPVEVKQLCFTIIANLCQGCKKNKKLFREKNGIDIILTNLKDHKIATSNRYALLGLSLLNCLWNAVLGSRRSQQIFINSQGVFDLLEFIQVCEYSHRKMSLSSLSFLTQNPKVVTQFLDWNGQNTMVNATQLLIRLYSQEDERYGVKYRQGIVTNQQKPLVPENDKKIDGDGAFLKDFTQSGTQTYLVNRIKEVVGTYDLRLIIFSILYRVGFNKNELNASEQQKMQVIQMYPHFKMGEIWGQIKKQLTEEGIEPTRDDSHWMQTSLEQFAEQMSNCVNTQSLIKKQFNQTQQKQLNRFFQVIKYNKQIK